MSAFPKTRHSPRSWACLKCTVTCRLAEVDWFQRIEIFKIQCHALVALSLRGASGNKIHPFDLLWTKCSLFKCNPLERDIVQATIRPHTPIIWQLYVLCTSVSNCSLFNIRPLIAVEDINSPRLYCRSFLITSCLSWWLFLSHIFSTQLPCFFTLCADAAKCIPCYWMKIDFIKRDPLNWDIVQTSVGSQSTLIRPCELLSTSISDFSLIWSRNRCFFVNTHYPDIPIKIWTAISYTSTDAWYKT